MSKPISSSSAATVDEEVAEPLLRDPPCPPGYVDPLEGSATLEDLVEAPPRAQKSWDVPSTHTG